MGQEFVVNAMQKTRYKAASATLQSPSQGIKFTLLVYSKLCLSQNLERKL